MKQKLETIILHVGLPKTGTTALQSWFRTRSSYLLKYGVRYPDFFGREDDKHSFLMSELRNNPSLPQLERLIAENVSPTLLLSNEGLSNHLYDFNLEALAQFRRLSQAANVVVFLIIREPEAWLKSYYKQCVLNPNNGSSPLWGTSLTQDEIRYHDRVVKLLDQGQLKADLTRFFGADRVVVFEYECINLLELILKEMNVPVPDDVELPRLNQSVPDWAIELLRLVNLFEDKTHYRRIWKAHIQSSLNSDHTILAGDYPAIAYPDMTKVAAEIKSTIQKHSIAHKDQILRFITALQQ